MNYKEFDDFFGRTSIGDVVEGVVKDFNAFGAIIDLGGCDGLLHSQNMGWKYVDDPEEIVKLGARLKLIVLWMDPQREQVSLSLKHFRKNPTKAIFKKYKMNSRVKGKVALVSDYGIFVDLDTDIEGFIHTPRLKKEGGEDTVLDNLVAGQEIEAVVIGSSVKQCRVYLDFKGVAPPLKSIPVAPVSQERNPGSDKAGEFFMEIPSYKCQMTGTDITLDEAYVLNHNRINQIISDNQKKIVKAKDLLDYSLKKSGEDSGAKPPTARALFSRTAVTMLNKCYPEENLFQEFNVFYHECKKTKQDLVNESQCFPQEYNLPPEGEQKKSVPVPLPSLPEEMKTSDSDEEIEGDTLDGRVVQLLPQGAVIDLGEYEGFLPASEICRPDGVISDNTLDIGQELKLQASKVDREEKTMLVSLKRDSPSVLGGTEERFPLGSICRGEVKKISPIGITVELASDVNGFVYWPGAADETISVQDIVNVKIVGHDHDSPRIYLEIISQEDSDCETF